MKLTKFSKKIIAIVSAIAMVVAGLVFVPATDASADAPDWGSVNYLGDGAGGGQYSNKYKYYCEDGSVVNIQKPGWADEAGIYCTFPAAGIQMDVDGYAVDGAGAVIYLSNFTQKVTEITITYAGGSTKAYVYYEDGEEGETTTADPSAPTAEPTTANPWKAIDNGGSQWFYNNATKQNISSVVNIQKPGWADEDGVYITVPAGISQVDVNGVTENVAALDGAGFVVYLSAMTKKINEVTITQGLGTSKIQIMNTEGSDESPTGETEAPTEAPTQETEAPTEAPTQETEAPTEAPTQETEAPTETSTEAPTEAPTQAPSYEWFSAANRWVHRQADGSFIAEDGAEYNGVAGISAAYSGDWGNAELEVANNESDLYTLPVNVVRSGNAGGWTMQLHLNAEGLDSSKVYDIAVKSDGNVIFTDSASAVAAYRKTIDIGGKLSVGEHTLTLEATESAIPPEPEVQTIIINPQTADIEANHNIWANWVNPSGTTTAYAYLEQVDNAHAAALLNNAWIFNDQAVQPMVGVDKVAQTRDASVVIEEGQTYTLIVESFDAWGRKTGYGELDITIPGLSPEEQEIQQYMAKINTAENLAYQKTALVAAGNNENTAGNICDGNKDSRWQADKAVDNSWFAVDLGDTYNVDTVLVSWEASNATAYEIYTAGSDGQYGNTPVATVSGLDNNKAVIKLSKNIGASARYVKVVVTGWSGNAEGYGISPYELAVFGSEEGYYNVEDYKGAGAVDPYPTEDGKIFAGWYTDDTCTTPYMEATGTAYAKFIDEKVLAGAYQLNNETTPTAIRFVSTIDCRDYQEIGFYLTGTYGNSNIENVKKSVKNIYKSVIAGGSTLTPTVEPFSQESTYLFTYAIRNLDSEKTFTMDYTPYFITADGTTVKGAVCHYPASH